MSSTTLSSTARDFKPTFILLLEVSASFKKFSDILGDGRDIEDFPSSWLIDWLLTEEFCLSLDVFDTGVSAWENGRAYSYFCCCW